MNKEQEIATMAKVLYGHYCGKNKCGECKQPRCMDYIRAEQLHNAGIGDKKQAVKEALDKVINEFDGTKDEFGCFIYLYNFDDIQRIITKLFTELYGADN